MSIRGHDLTRQEAWDLEEEGLTGAGGAQGQETETDRQKMGQLGD